MSTGLLFRCRIIYYSMILYRSWFEDSKAKIRFETKTERALFARVIAGEANWMEQNSLE